MGVTGQGLDRVDGVAVDGLPAANARAESIEPVFEMLPGWRVDTTSVRNWDELPQAARDYLGRLGEIIGTDVDFVGVGPDRTQSIVRPGSWLASQVAR